MQTQSEIMCLQKIDSQAGCAVNAAAAITAVRFGIKPSKYRKVLWQCNHKFSNGEKFATSNIYEIELMRICVDVQNQLISDRLLILETCKTFLDSLFQDPALLQKQKNAELVYDKAHNERTDFVEANKWQLTDQAEYQKTCTALENAVKQAKTEFEQAVHAVHERLTRKIRSTSSSKTCLNMKPFWNDNLEGHRLVRIN